MPLAGMELVAVELEHDALGAPHGVHFEALDDDVVRRPWKFCRPHQADKDPLSPGAREGGFGDEGSEGGRSGSPGSAIERCLDLVAVDKAFELRLLERGGEIMGEALCARISRSTWRSGESVLRATTSATDA